MPWRQLEAQARRADLRPEAEKIGRDPAGTGFALLANWYREDLSRRNDEGKRFILTGSDAQVAEDAAALRDVGATRLMLNFLRPSLERTFAAIDRFRDNVMARLAS